MPEVRTGGHATVLALWLALAFAGCGGVRSATTSASFDGAAYPPGVRAYDFALRDQRGRDVSLGPYRGDVVVLSFLSSNCRACTLVAQQIRGALDELGSPADVKTIFISTDRDSDTHASIRRFLAATSLTTRATFLTGALGQLRLAWRAYSVPPDTGVRGRRSGEDAVTVLLIDRSGYERVGFGLEQLTPESLAHDIDILVAR